MKYCSTKTPSVLCVSIVLICVRSQAEQTGTSLGQCICCYSRFFFSNSTFYSCNWRLRFVIAYWLAVFFSCNHIQWHGLRANNEQSLKGCNKSEAETTWHLRVYFESFVTCRPQVFHFIPATNDHSDTNLSAAQLQYSQWLRKQAKWINLNSDYYMK